MSRRTFDDLGTEVEAEIRGERAGLLVLIAVIALAIIACSTWMEGRVAERLRITEGAWQFDRAALPAWIPSDFRGTLAAIERVPETVPLRSANWRRRVANALEANPWVESVQRIDRTSRGVTFSARFLRPVVAVQVIDGFLLLDSTRRVIDTLQGSELDPAWNLPIYYPQRSDLPLLAPGTLLDQPEFEECLAIVRELWEVRIPERFPGQIPSLECYAEARSPGLLWRLNTPHGVHLYWGRSPASEQVSLRSAQHKIRSLEEVLDAGEAIRGAGGISLYDEEPTVVGRR